MPVNIGLPELGQAAVDLYGNYLAQEGISDASQNVMTGIEEKPTERFFVNGGIYVLSPEAFDAIEPGVALDMPTLLTRLHDAGGKVAVFPLAEYWRDIGQIDDLEAARSEFGSVFGA